MVDLRTVTLLKPEGRLKWLTKVSAFMCLRCVGQSLFRHEAHARIGPKTVEIAES